ncbi:hypothetical protein J6590_013252 [Homalodisca vitripennis]|nr:hypothetical protein J6590_013252 [Homalodisca vitripennis]
MLACDNRFSRREIVTLHTEFDQSTDQSLTRRHQLSRHLARHEITASLRGTARCGGHAHLSPVIHGSVSKRNILATTRHF